MERIDESEPDLVIIDSIQTMQSPEIDSVPGSVAQIRECTGELIQFAKESNTPVILIGHITKEGSLAGPKVLEHMVDCVLQFEGDRQHVYRLLRAIKNRFGSTNELGIYEMVGGGLREVIDPTDILVHQKDSALLFTSAYVANEWTLIALSKIIPNICFVSDSKNHASLIVGMSHSRASKMIFEHNNMEELEFILREAVDCGKIPCIVFESVYSMDGDAAPLRAVAELCEIYNAALIVDEAHSNGIFGEVGQGKVVELGLEEKVFARVMTFGKALGCHGAIVLGSGFLKDFLINYSQNIKNEHGNSR